MRAYTRAPVETSLPSQRKAREPPPHLGAISRRFAADSHRLSVALFDQDVRDVGGIQEGVDLTKVSLVSCGQRNGHGVWRYAARRTFTSGMDSLSDSRPNGEVRSDYDVVR